MKHNEQNINSLHTMRRALFDTMFEIRNGTRDLEDAHAISKLSHNIIEAYKVEIKAVEVANDISDANLKLKSNLKALE